MGFNAEANQNNTRLLSSQHLPAAGRPKNGVQLNRTRPALSPSPQGNLRVCPTNHTLRLETSLYRSLQNGLDPTTLLEVHMLGTFEVGGRMGNPAGPFYDGKQVGGQVASRARDIFRVKACFLYPDVSPTILSVVIQPFGCRSRNSGLDHPRRGGGGVGTEYPGGNRSRDVRLRDQPVQTRQKQLLLDVVREPLGPMAWKLIDPMIDPPKVDARVNSPPPKAATACGCYDV